MRRLSVHVANHEGPVRHVRIMAEDYLERNRRRLGLSDRLPCGSVARQFADHVPVPLCELSSDRFQVPLNDFESGE